MNKRRQSLRLKGYDYSRSGAYFVTICTHNRRCLFGEIKDADMVLNQAGVAASECWRKIPEHFPQVELDAYVIMPNHVHGILVINETVGAKNFSPLPSGRPRGTSKTIGSVVRGYKIGVTKWMRQNTTACNVWQRNYYEHIIRNETELNRIREYIRNNPAQWDTDRENPRGMGHHYALQPWEAGK